MADLEELAARVEGLTGLDRAVDIAVALGQPDRFFNAGPKYDGAPDRIGMIHADGSQSLPGNAPDMLVPRYTASIEAAMTLIDPAYRLSVSETAIEGLPRWEVVLIRRDADFGRGRKITVTGHTLPTTIAAAALRARSRTQGNPDG